MTPNPIKEYYISYFDILGYKDYFANQSKSVTELLTYIHRAIRNTEQYVKKINASKVLSEMGKIDIKVKIFSDNIIMCMEVLSEASEHTRMLLFLQLVADIQRDFVNEYALFVRGGICKGQLSFNEDYVFGEGLIRAVGIEGAAIFPRIIIDEDFVATIHENKFFKEIDFKRALTIENKMIENKPISEEEVQLYKRIRYQNTIYLTIQQLFNRLMYKNGDGRWSLNYLNSITDIIPLPSEITDDDTVSLKSSYLYEDRLLKTHTTDKFSRLEKHRIRVEEQLQKYGNYYANDIIESENKEKILKKYMWVLNYHNNCCSDLETYHEINANCDFDRRFFSMLINVMH